MASYSSPGPSKRYSYSLSSQQPPATTAYETDHHKQMMPFAYAQQPEFQQGSSSGHRSEEEVVDYSMWHEDSESRPYRMEIDTTRNPAISSSPRYDGHNTMPAHSWAYPIPHRGESMYHACSTTRPSQSHSVTTPSYLHHTQSSSYSSLSQALSYTTSHPYQTLSDVRSTSATAGYAYCSPYDAAGEYDQGNYDFVQVVPSTPPHRSSFSLGQATPTADQAYDHTATSPGLPSSSPLYGSSSDSGLDSPEGFHLHTPPDPLRDNDPSEEIEKFWREFNSPKFNLILQQALEYIESHPDAISIAEEPILPAVPLPPMQLPSSPYLMQSSQYTAQMVGSSRSHELYHSETMPYTPYYQGYNAQDDLSTYRDSRRGSDQYSIVEGDAPMEVQDEDDDLDKFIQIVANSERFDDNATIDEALKKLGLQNLQQKLPGMEITLMPHQVLGVAWMLDKEKGAVQGGCLADEMGLGKTVQMIATMVANRSKDEKHRSTLVIAPLALLDQWQHEIENRTNCDLKCFKYHGQGRPITKAELIKYDVVLTTYGTMSHEWPDYEKEVNAKARARRRGEDYILGDDDEEMKHQDYRNQKRKQNAGLLFQVEWYRVVADEAQNIRNRKTRVSRAINDLSATYRWCLTGTPVVNTLTDSYGYLRFLQIRPWYDWKEFNDHIAKLEKRRTNLAVKRLQAINAIFLLRRKKDSKLDGKTLVELPEKEVKLVKLEFSNEERQIYDMVERRSQARFNRFLKAGTVLKHYHRVLVLLLRLRQICAHPSLIQEGGSAFLSGDDEDDDTGPIIATELTRAQQSVSPQFVEKLRAKLKLEALDRIHAEKESEGNATIDEDDCPICYEPMTEAVFTACAHSFCRECIKAFITQRGKEEATTITTRIEKPCPVCRGTITEEKLFLRSAFEPSDEELKLISDDMNEDMDVDVPQLCIDKGKARAQEPELCDFSPPGEGDNSRGDIAYMREGNNVQASFVVQSDVEGAEDVIFGRSRNLETSVPEQVPSMPKFLPSSKMKFMMEQLQALARDKPNEKVLVVSQWTSCLSLVSHYLTEKNIAHVKYQGDMTPAKREQAVQVFMSKEKATVMLMSLKCGGVGLNLTRANNVISLDLGWSPAVESQAFDRVHRVGQTKRVLVQRIVIAGTVEDRILDMQRRKQALADGSLGEGSGKKIGKLSVRELANLFGLDRQGRRLQD